MDQQSITFPSPVRRVLIRIKDDHWEIVEEHSITSKTLPPSFEMPDAAAEQGVIGAWYEAVDGAGKPVYRRPMQNPAQALTEFVDDDEKLTNVAADLPERFVQVLVPDLPAIESLVFYASDRAPIRVDPESGAVEAKPLARLPIGQQPEGSEDGA